MVSNRRGPASDCGCCAPPCTCLIAKETFRGVANAISISGPSISIPDRCYSSPLTGSFSASVSIDYDDGICGNSTGSGICPARQSHYFGPLSITVGDFTPVTKTTYLAGRMGSCLIPTNPCSIVDTSIDCPGSNLCCGFGPYGQLPAYYNYVANAGVGISYSCLGGNSGTPIYSLYVAAQYVLTEFLGSGFTGWNSSLDGVPAAPTGWTRTGGGGGYIYVRSDGKATLTLSNVFRWYTLGKFCNGVFSPFSNAEQTWQLSAYTQASTDNATSVTLDYPFDPAGIFAGVVGTVT